MPGPVLESDILDALKTTKPSPILHINKYKKWVEEFGSV